MAEHRAARITDTYGDTVGYTYRGWTLRKEFYADGPSMFTWTITTPAGELNAGVHETNRLADAKKAVDRALDGA